MNWIGNTKLIITLAWKNVWKNKRRSFLTLLTIIAGSTMIILMNAISLGSHDQMIEDAVALNTGHIQIHEKGYWDNRSLDYAFKDDSDVNEFIKKLMTSKKIKAYSKRIIAGGLFSHKDTTAGAILMGVEPDKAKNVTTVFQKIKKGGRYLKVTDKNKIILGKTLAKNLGATVGSSISIISQSFIGSIAAENVKVIGLFESGNPEYDRSIAMMNFSQAKETFLMMNYINSIVVRLNKVKEMTMVKNKIKKYLKAKQATCMKTEDSLQCSKYEVLGWNELMPELVQWIAMDDFGLYVFDFILFMVVAFGLLNTIQMSVFERTRELGVMLAIGTTPRQVTVMVICESFFITLIGVLMGIAFGSALSIYFTYFPIEFTDYAQEFAAFQMNTTILPAHLTVSNILWTAVLLIVLSLLFTYFPARRASKLNPIDAIRQL